MILTLNYFSWCLQVLVQASSAAVSQGEGGTQSKPWPVSLGCKLGSCYLTQSFIHLIEQNDLSATHREGSIARITKFKELDDDTAMVQGAKLAPLAASLAIGLAIRFLIPVPEGLTSNAWSLLSIFVSTIAGVLDC